MERPIESKWLKLIPPELRHRHREVPAKENAYGLWLEASRRTRNFDDPDLLLEALDEERPFPPGERGRAVEAWIERIEASLELFDRGVRLGRFQFPGGKSMVADDASVIQGIGFFSAARILQAKALAAEKGFEAAGRKLQGLCKALEIFLKGEGILLTYLAGTAHKIKVLAAMRWLAREPDVPARVLEKLISAIRSSPGEIDVFTRSLKVEFCRYLLPHILRFQPGEGSGHEALAESLLGRSKGEARKRLRSGFIALLRDHPRPFDMAGTIGLAGSLFKGFLKDCGSSQKNRVRKLMEGIEREVRAWPAELIPDFGLGACLKVASKTKVERARRALRRVMNPVGKVLLDMTMTPFLVAGERCLLRSIAEREATLAVLGLRIRSIRKRELPASLKALVREGILPEAPVDPYSGKPLSYSREGRLLWSIDSLGKKCVWSAPKS